MSLTKVLRLRAFLSQQIAIKGFVESVRFRAHSRRLSSSCKNEIKTSSATPFYMTCSNTLQPEECKTIYKDMVVFENFLSESEEKTIFDEIEPYMSRLHYEYDHWDNAIHGFRETERLHWTQPSMLILDKVRQAAFPDGKPQLQHVHVLDLSADGYIKPHIDSIKFCGDTIAGLSLLSDSVMRLVHEKDSTKIVDVLLKQRSLYIMRDSARYDYTHEILKQVDSKFKSEIVPKGRRISVICRSEVTKKQ